MKSRRFGTHAAWIRTISLLLAATLAITVSRAASADVLGGALASVMGREPQLTPDRLGDGGLDGLQFADPAEGIDLVAPPEPNNQGSAELSHPIWIPPGRGGVQPDLTLQYSSRGGNGWLGTGWDLSVGEIAVDTRWGVPRFETDVESETYTLDGDVLSPTAVRAEWQARVARRNDFTRRTENQFEHVVRHGDSPGNYWWEVTDKMGAKRWYGGIPDCGGPQGDDPGVDPGQEPGLGSREASAILTDANGNGYRWALSASRDIGGNLIRYFYETETNEPVGGGDGGKRLYLSRIRYTGWAPGQDACAPGPDDPNDPDDPYDIWLRESPKEDEAYEVRLLRDDDVSPAPTPRRDVIVDARGGFAESTADLLRRIEVYHGAYDETADPVTRPSRTAYDDLVRRYDLNYVEGAFGKSLLASVDQLGSDGNIYATNRFDYFDDVREGGQYVGFSDAVPYQPGNDGLEQNLFEDVETSVLGASKTTSGDGHLYVGFNPSTPLKEGSFGGAVTIKGGSTEALAEFIDLNGDLLPDKVFHKDGQVMFRLNESGPGGRVTFSDPPRPVQNLNDLSSEFMIGVGGGYEAHAPGASVQFNVSGDVTVGRDYFIDVNDDGLADYVNDGDVKFNHLVEVSGDMIPTFSDSSALTKVPVESGDADLPVIQRLAELEEQLRNDSPLVDSVRRWVPPYSGTVRVSGVVSFEPPPDTRVPPPPAYDGDGVRVAIQRGDQEMWSTHLAQPGHSALINLGGSDPASMRVERGQPVYFRVQSVDNGYRDRVRWDPRIDYVAFDGVSGGVPLDVNGLNQGGFQASLDFTLAGRPGTTITMPLNGTVHFETPFTKARQTSDDLAVVVLKNGVPVLFQPFAWHWTGTTTVAGDFPVSAPSGSSADQFEVKISISTPIDIRGIDWKPRLYYTQATDSEGHDVPVTDPTGKRTLELIVPADTDIYPTNAHQAPVFPWNADLDGDTFRVRGSVGVFGSHQGGTATLTVKQRNELVAKSFDFAIPASSQFGSSGQTTLFNVPLVKGEQYWFDLTLHDAKCTDPTNCKTPMTSRGISSSVEILNADGTVNFGTPPHNRFTAGQQGMFPISYRGWGAAGYRGEGDLGEGDRANQAMVQSDFDFRRENFPERDPEGFNDPGYKDPADANAFVFVPYWLDGTVRVWRGAKDNMVVGGNFASSSRRGADDVSSISDVAATGEGVGAVRRVGISAPTFSLAGTLGPLGASFGAGPSFGLLDYMDMNGDSFPDIVSVDYTKYTGPRGGYLEKDDDNTAVLTQDVSFAVGGGFTGSAVDINANSKGDANTPQNVAPASGNGRQAGGQAAANGQSASADQDGFSIGGSLGVQVQFTNPNESDPGWDSALDAMPSALAPLEQELADVNGDGLPDRVKVNPEGIKVQLGTGYGFLGEVEWAGGGFETGKQFSGSVGPTLGFQISNKAFSGGLALNEAIDLADFSWVDVDGDGVLDRLRRAGDDSIMVAFGTGVGVLPEVDYGTTADGEFDLAGIDIPTGEQIAQSRSRGLGAGFDFTIGIGPLCIGACYIIVNPGVHVDHSISTSQIQLMDVNGDGYPDSLLSDADDKLGVRENRRGRTNMLKTVHQAIGGEIRLDYSRSGNTEDQPYSQWDVASVEVDDHRPGDGADTLLSTFSYEGGKASRLEREVLGFSAVTEVQRAFAGDNNVFDDQVLRQYRRTYLNGTVFESGQVTSEQLLTPDGVPLLTTESTWQFVDLATNEPVDLSFSAADPAGVRFLGMAVTPQRTKVEQRWHDTAGGAGQSTWNTYEYDTRGNVVRQVDVGEPEVASDDIIAVTHYTECAFRNLDPETGDTTRDQFGDPITFGVGGPLPDGTYAYTWASVPDILDVFDADCNLLRHRDALGPNRIESPEGAAEGVGKPCDNQSLTRLDEQFSGDGDAAITELAYDPWGSYRYVYYPDNDELERYKVDYVYDPDNHTHIARTTDSHELVSTATFDPFSGRIASRTDANGQTTSYTYDPFGRLASITGPYEQGTGHASVTFEYNPSAAYASGIAHHFDAFHPDDTIDTVQFVDGIGRTTQRKQDATVFTGAATPASDVMVVSGAVTFDNLGPEVEAWYPTSEPLGTPGTFQAQRSSVDPTATTWDLRDRPVSVVAPGGRTTTTTYGFGGDADFGATLFTTTVTDPNGKPQVTYSDVRDAVYGFDDVPSGAATIRTRYHIDGLGQLLGVVDNGGNTTAHTYDMLGRRTSTSTPDAGLVEYRWDNASNLVAQIDENLRAAGAGHRVSYDYDVDRLVAIDYPDGTPDVAYTYGGVSAPDNGAGRVVAIIDGAREQTIAYDPMGQLAREVSTMLVHNLSDDTQEAHTFTTSFTYDGLGRVNQLAYPDGEVLSHGYDSGGLLNSISGSKAGIDYGYVDRLEYDEFFDRKLQRTGNGVETEYGFDAETRWLSRQVTNTPVREVQDLNYTYDLVGNILQLHNDVPIPTSDLRGGPSTQNYRYDPYYRLESADGMYQFPPDKRRDYTYNVTYDVNGNVTSKKQTDIVTSPGTSPSEQKDTTYQHKAIEYRTDNPHQIARIGRRPYTYDLNGNFTSWTDDKSGQSRTVTWDATNRARTISNQGSTTSFTYDHAGRRAIERGPSGETAFVNQWYMVRNGEVAWKHIWAGHDRLAEQQVYDDGTYEDRRYFMHKDLQGSTNVVTDDTGLMFQHAEYFPSGEVWVDEDSDVHRTPYLYGGGYFDEVRQLIDLGERWYEPREQFLYSPDPILADDPSAVLGDPALLPAYSYAESNPLRLGDFNGRQPWSTRALFAAAGVGVLQRAGSAFARLGQTSSGSGSSRVLVGSWGEKLANAARLKPGSRFERFEANPLVEINLAPTDDGWGLQDVRLSGIVTPQAVLKRASAQAAARAAPPAPAVAPAPAHVANAAPAAAAIPGQNAAPARNRQVRPTRPLPPIPNRAVPPAPSSSN